MKPGRGRHWSAPRVAQIWSFLPEELYEDADDEEICLMLGIKKSDDLEKEDTGPMPWRLVEMLNFGPPQPDELYEDADDDEDLALLLGFKKFDDHGNKDTSHRSHNENNSK